jgi:hypothetical protein
VWVWRGVLALDHWGFAAAIVLSSTLGASQRIFGHSVMLLATSALVSAALLAFGAAAAAFQGKPRKTS